MKRGLKFALVIVIAIATNIGLRIGFGHRYCSYSKCNNQYSHESCNWQNKSETAK